MAMKSSLARSRVLSVGRSPGPAKPADELIHLGWWKHGNRVTAEEQEAARKASKANPPQTMHNKKPVQIVDAPNPPPRDKAPKIDPRLEDM